MGSGFGLMMDGSPDSSSEYIQLVSEHGIGKYEVMLEDGVG